MRAFGWMEIVAMKEGRRSRDVEFAKTIFGEDMARAHALEDKGLLSRPGDCTAPLRPPMRD